MLLESKLQSSTLGDKEDENHGSETKGLQNPA